MLKDDEFQDEAAIEIMAALAGGGADNFHGLMPQGINYNPAGCAEKAYALATALLEHRRKLPGRAKGFKSTP